MKDILLTGSAGFIGFHVTQYLLENNRQIVGYDNVNNYYDTKLKEDRIKILQQYPAFQFVHDDLCNNNILNPIIQQVYCFQYYKFETGLDLLLSKSPLLSVADFIWLGLLTTKWSNSPSGFLLAHPSYLL